MQLPLGSCIRTEYKSANLADLYRRQRWVAEHPVHKKSSVSLLRCNWSDNAVMSNEKGIEYPSPNA
jgi:hypothetical protein